MKLAEYRKITKKKHKYGAVKVEIDGIKFDSKAEAQAFFALKAEIGNGSGGRRALVRNHTAVMLPGDIRLQPDFAEVETGKVYCPKVVGWHEYKGMETPAYRMKKKLYKALDGLPPLYVWRYHGKRLILVEVVRHGISFQWNR